MTSHIDPRTLTDRELVDAFALTTPATIYRETLRDELLRRLSNAAGPDVPQLDPALLHTGYEKYGELCDTFDENPHVDPLEGKRL